MATTAETITGLFRAVLQRDPDAAALRAFSAALDARTPLTTLVRALVTSPEVKTSVAPIIRTYQAAFGRVADQVGLDAWVDALAAGRPLQQISRDFTASQEFSNLYGTGTSVTADFVKALYRNVLGREGAAAEVQGWLDRVATPSSGYPDRGAVLFGFAQSGEFVTRAATAVETFLTSAGAGTQTYTGTLTPATGTTTGGSGTTTGSGGTTSGGTGSGTTYAAVNDVLSATEDTAATYAANLLLGNDTGLTSISSVTAVTGGTVVLNQNGSVTFTPAQDFTGAASFRYAAAGGTKDYVAVATVNVAPVNDAPTAANLNANLSLRLNTGAAATNLFRQPLTVADVDSTNLTATLALSNMAAGTLTGATSQGAGIYTITGAATLLNTALAAVKFLPTAGFGGDVNVGVEISDGANGPQGTNPTGSVAVNVNRAPTANPDGGTVAGGTGLTLTYAQLLANDTDSDGDVLSVLVAGYQSGSGNVSVDGAARTITLTPNSGATLVASYSISDNRGGFSQSTVTVMGI